MLQHLASRVSLRVVTGSSVGYCHGPRCWLDPATKAIVQTTSWRQLTITYTHRRFWQIYCPLECWYGGCILYIGLQIFTVTLWQKSKVGVRIIFDGVLYSKFYGKCICMAHYSLGTGVSISWLSILLSVNSCGKLETIGYYFPKFSIFNPLTPTVAIWVQL